MHKRNIDDECIFCFNTKRAYTSFREIVLFDHPLCPICLNKLKVVNKDVVVNNLKVHCLYEYNEFYSDLIIQYKELHDEALKSIFFYKHANLLSKKYKGYVIVLAPSSLNKIKERGFNHLDKMVEILKLPTLDCLFKEEGVDQKRSNKKTRGEIEKRIKLKSNVDKQQKILIVDDVVTTGSTIKSIYELFKDYKEVKLLTNSISQTYLRKVKNKCKAK